MTEQTTTPSFTIGNLVTAEMATRVKRLMLFSRYRVEGYFVGDNKSAKKGFSADFMQHRQYFPGDNIKYLDWRVYGRTDRLVVREFEELTNLDLYLVIDHSASMGFGSQDLTKYEFSVRCAAILIYLMTVQKDAFGLSLFSDGLVEGTETGTSRRHLRRVCEALLRSPPAGVADWQSALHQAQARIKRRGLVVVFSDFMADPLEVGKGLAGFRSRGCDVIAFHVMDPFEMELRPASMTRFIDVEDGTAVTVDPLAVRTAYAEQFATHAEEVRQECTRRGIAYVSLKVADDYEVVIGDYLQHRMRVLM